MSQIALQAGVGRESLYKSLTPGASPRYTTIVRVLRALGVELQARPLHALDPSGGKTLGA